MAKRCGAFKHSGSVRRDEFGRSGFGAVVGGARDWPRPSASAVQTVSTMQFTLRAKTNPDDLTWGVATFYWRTVPLPPGTNTPGVVPLQ